MNTELIKQLREETGAGVMDAKNALQETGDNFDKAKELLMQKGFERAEKRSDREVTSGKIYSYIHGNGHVGVLVEVNCETDFVAKTDEIASLAHEVALQIASMNPKDTEELVNQAYIRDSKKTINELVKEVTAKTGENVAIGRFSRFELGN